MKKEDEGDFQAMRGSRMDKGVLHALKRSVVIASGVANAKREVADRCE